MGKSEIIDEVKSKFLNEMSYTRMKNMSRNEYFKFAKDIFIWLEPYKQGGLTADDIFAMANNDIYYFQSTHFDSDNKYEIRFTLLFEELIEYCNEPYFWRTPLDEYLKKWDWFYIQKEYIP